MPTDLATLDRQERAAKISAAKIAADVDNAPSARTRAAAEMALQRALAKVARVRARIEAVQGTTLPAAGLGDEARTGRAIASDQETG